MASTDSAGVAKPRLVGGGVAVLAQSPRTKDRPFAQVLADAAELTLTAGTKADVTQATVTAASQRWGALSCALLDAAAVDAWQKELTGMGRARALKLFFAAAANERVLGADLGSRVVAADIYANPVWALRAGSAGGYAAGGLIGGLAMAGAGAIMRATGSRGGRETTAAQLKRALGQNQYIWVTDTHIAFVQSSAPRLMGDCVVRAAVPLSAIESVKKAPRLQLLARFTIAFTDGSRAAFMSWGKQVKRLKAALAGVGVG